MHVVVVGCGRVGSGLAQDLINRGHTVAVIDRDETAFGRLGDDGTATMHLGIGFDRDLLVAAGIEHAGALAAVTNGDNSNIVIARVARETFRVEHVVARIYDPRRAEIYQRLGIPTVATSSWTIEQVLRHLTPTGHAVEWSDPAAEISLVEHHVASALAGTAFSDLEVDGVARVIAYTRLGHTDLVSPDLACQEGDVLYLAARNDRLDDLDIALARTGGVSR